MNKKMQYQLLLIVLVAIVIFNLAIIFSSMISADNTYNVTTVGHNDNGTVYKIEAGNLSSDKTIGIIIGVHPREHQIHEAINETIYNITAGNGDHNLTKKYVVYYVKTKDNLTSRDDTRPAGEQLANQLIVPNIAKDKPFLVVDVHEINPDYEYSNFVFSLSDRTPKINSYIKNITNAVNLVYYDFDMGTSPEKVTKPIADMGINTLLIEIATTSSLPEKQQTAENLIRCLDSLEP